MENSVIGLMISLFGLLLSAIALHLMNNSLRRRVERLEELAETMARQIISRASRP